MKKNKEAVKILRRAYNNLARSIDAITDLEVLFLKTKDKRLAKAGKVACLIIKAQSTLNPMAEDDDIRIV